MIFFFFSETGKLAKPIGYTLVRTPGAHHLISKIKPLSTTLNERGSQTPFGSFETFDKLSAFEVCFAYASKQTYEFYVP